MDNENEHDKPNDEIDKLVSQFRNLNEVVSQKQFLEHTLKQLTFCNHLAVLSKNSDLFSSKVLNVSTKVVCNSSSLHLQAVQTLIIAIENVSDKFEFDNKNWQFHVELNEKTRGSWPFKKKLCPGTCDKFCVPITKQSFHFPLMKISISLQFTIEFESKMYTKMFEVMECSIDVLDCLDMEKYFVGNDFPDSFKSTNFIDISDEIHQTKLEFPLVNRFVLRLDSSLKGLFVKDIFLRDSLHRGFENHVDEMSSKNNFSVYYLGIPIDVSITNTDIIKFTCSNPSVLCAVKVSIMRRLATIEGIILESSDVKDSERLHDLDLKLQTLRNSDPRSVTQSDYDELMQLYLELRDIGESIRYSLAPIVE